MSSSKGRRAKTLAYEIVFMFVLVFVVFRPSPSTIHPPTTKPGSDARLFEIQSYRAAVALSFDANDVALSNGGVQWKKGWGWAKPTSIVPIHYG